MRKLTRGAAALILGSAMATSVAAQPTVAPPGGPAVKAPEVRPTGNAATVNGKAIPEMAVYRALRQFPDAHKEMARKEIMAHLIENALIDQYLNAFKVVVEEKDVDKLIADLKKELIEAKKDYAKELEAMMLTEAEFRVEVTAQMKWEKFVQQQGTDAALKQLFDGSPDVFDGTMVRARHVLMTPGNDEAKQKDAAQKLRGIKQVVEQEAAKAVAALPPTADAVAKEQAKATQHGGTVLRLREGILGLPLEEGRRRPELLPARWRDGRAVRQGRVRAEALRDDRRGRYRVRLSPDPRDRSPAGYGEEVRGREGRRADALRDAGPRGRHRTDEAEGADRHHAEVRLRV